MYKKRSKGLTRAALLLLAAVVLSACAGPAAPPETQAAATQAAATTSVAATTTVVAATAADDTAATTAAAAASAGAPAAAGDDGVTPAGEFPIVTAPLTLQVATVVQPQVEDIHTNAATLMFETVSGIDLEIVDLPASDTMTKVNLMFASNDLPDVFTGLSFPRGTMQQYIDAGRLVQMDTYIEEYGVGYREFLGFLGDDAELYERLVTFPDGHRYSIDYANTNVGGNYDGFGSIYEPWLEKFNEPMPATLDDFYNVLTRFKNEDANGNGIGDEMPISGITTLAPRLISYIGNAFQYTDYTYRLAVNDGVISFVAGNELYKETLQFMNRMCAEGLIDPLIFTQSQPELSATMSLEDLTVGVIISPSISSFMDITQERCRRFVPLPALVGPHGFSTAYNRGVAFGHAYMITSECENPAAAYRLGDYWQSEEGNNLYRYGVKGTHWDDPDPGATNAIGEPAYIKIIEDVWGYTSQNVIWRNNGVPYLLDNRYSGRQSDGDPYEYEAKKLAAGLAMEKVAAQEFVPSALPYATPEDTARVAELRETLVGEKGIVMEYSVGFIVGDIPFDQWDRYVADLDRAGVNEYVEIIQRNYDLLFK